MAIHLPVRNGVDVWERAREFGSTAAAPFVVPRARQAGGMDFRATGPAATPRVPGAIARASSAVAGTSQGGEPLSVSLRGCPPQWSSRLATPESDALPRAAVATILAAVVVVVVVGIALVSTALTIASPVASAPAVSPAQAVVAVAPGDSLWSIAEKAGIGASVEEGIGLLRAANPGIGEVLMPGDVLVVPQSVARAGSHSWNGPVG